MMTTTVSGRGPRSLFIEWCICHDSSMKTSTDYSPEPLMLSSVDTASLLPLKDASSALECMDCTKAYVGQSGRTICDRVKEHQRAVKNGDTDSSAIAEHTWQRRARESSKCLLLLPQYLATQQAFISSL